MKNWKHYNKLQINFFQNNQNFDSGEKSTSKHTEPEFNAS